MDRPVNVSGCNNLCSDFNQNFHLQSWRNEICKSRNQYLIPLILCHVPLFLTYIYSSKKLIYINSDDLPSGRWPNQHSRWVVAIWRTSKMQAHGRSQTSIRLVFSMININSYFCYIEYHKPTNGNLFDGKLVAWSDISANDDTICNAAIRSRIIMIKKNINTLLRYLHSNTNLSPPIKLIQNANGIN